MMMTMFTIERLKGKSPNVRQSRQQKDCKLQQHTCDRRLKRCKAKDEPENVASIQKTLDRRFLNKVLTGFRDGKRDVLPQ